MKSLRWGGALLGLTALTAVAQDKITPDQQEYSKVCGSILEKILKAMSLTLEL